MAKKVIAAQLEIKGLKNVLNNMDKAGKDVINAVFGGVDQTNEEVFNASQAEVVVDKGLLRASAIIEPAKRVGRTVVASIRYTRKYAFEIHETPPGTFNKPRKHGKWRYLADPIEQHAPALIDNVANHIKRVL